MRRQYHRGFVTNGPVRKNTGRIGANAQVCNDGKYHVLQKTYKAIYCRKCTDFIDCDHQYRNCYRKEKPRHNKHYCNDLAQQIQEGYDTYYGM